MKKKYLSVDFQKGEWRLLTEGDIVEIKGTFKETDSFEEIWREIDKAWLSVAQKQ